VFEMAGAERDTGKRCFGAEAANLRLKALVAAMDGSPAGAKPSYSRVMDLDRFRWLLSPADEAILDTLTAKISAHGAIHAIDDEPPSKTSKTHREDHDELLSKLFS